MSKNNPIIAIASDHAGFDLKQKVYEFLKSKDYKVVDLGPDSGESVDYPDYGFALADTVAGDKADLGIGICGTGIGISIALNRNSNIRAALCCDFELAAMSRKHNDANVLALGARYISVEAAIKCVEVFLNTEFEGDRHARRVNKLGNYKQHG